MQQTNTHTITANGSVFCFGELLLRYSPVLERQWIHQAGMSVYVGGAELNVATALCSWGHAVKYATALPDNYLSHEIMAELNDKKIDTSAILLQGDRIGTYYLPQGADLKHAGVIYDRAYSAFAALQPGQVNWSEVLSGCSWFHFSAISPALNANVATVCLEAVKAARAMGLTVSVDLNYRSKLWQYGVAPAAVMPELVSYCDVVMGNCWAAESLLGITSPVKESAGLTEQELLAAAAESMKQLQQQYSSVKQMAYTFRLADTYWAVYNSEGNIDRSVTFSIGQVIDRVGSGDCFMGGIIHGLRQQLEAAHLINFAAAAAVGKLHETGDATRQTVADVENRLKEMKTAAV